MTEKATFAQQLKMDDEDFNVLKSILQKFVSDCEVRAFGSRVSGTSKPFSDLDLVIMTKSPLSFTTLGGLMEALSESRLPFRVDVVDWSNLSSAFRALIHRNFLRLPLE